MPRLRRPETAGDSATTEPASPLREKNELLQRALLRAQNTQSELREMIEQITAAPWYPVLFQGPIETEQGLRAMVWTSGLARLVNLHPNVQMQELATGDPVYLDHELATLMASAKGTFEPPTDAADFERLTKDGRVVVRSRGEELVLTPGAGLDTDALRAGQLVLFDRPSRLALDSLDGVDGNQYLLEEIAEGSLEDVGGRRENLDELIAVLSASLVAPELAQTYRLDGRRAILLYGPPGCGKTLMARIAVAEIQRITGRRCYFFVVRPGEFESPYVGETEANIRKCFRSLREAAGDDLVVLFLDEIESIGRSRGASGGRHSDRFLAALLAEIDGFCARGQVSILAATNRRDLLDPALLSRLSDTQIAVPRPNRQAASEILGIHLSNSLPYARDGATAAAKPDSREAAKIRCEIVDVTISRLYAPNAENAISQLSLRDGTSRTVHARELMSGRLLEQLARAVRERAFRRHIRDEGQGLRISDAVACVENTLAELSTTLSIHNTRAYLDDLPEDIDVVRVEPIRPQPEGRSRFYNAA